MHTIMTTTNMPEHKRFALWREAVCDHFIQVECHRTGNSSFDGEITSTRIRDVSFSLARVRAHKCVRSPSLIRRSKAELVFIHQQLSGTWHYSQDGRKGTLSPGDFTCLDGTRPYSAIQEDDHKQLVLHMPRDLWIRRFGPTEPLTGYAVRANTPMGALAANTLQQILAVIDVAKPHTADRLLDVSLSLIMTAFGDLVLDQAARRDCGRTALLYRAKAYICENSHNAALNPGMVAAALDISERHLQSLFNDEGTTVGKHIWDARLASCRRYLSDPLLAQAPIRDIANRCGFTNFSHFSHRFKSAFSMTATEFRRRQLDGAGRNECLPIPSQNRNKNCR
jgi:AraC-like DNA-binding protein